MVFAEHTWIRHDVLIEGHLAQPARRSRSIVVARPIHRTTDLLMLCCVEVTVHLRDPLRIVSPHSHALLL